MRDVINTHSRVPASRKVSSGGNCKVPIETTDRYVAIQESSAKDANELGFVARLLIQATIPHSKPKSNEWSRKNGNLTVHMMAPSSVGLPYGCYARLLLVWLTTQAIRNKSRMDKGVITQQEAYRIELGHSQRGFMAELGLIGTGGKEGSIGRLRDQMNRLFKTTISAIITEYSEEGGYVTQNDAGARVTDFCHIWWSTNQPEQNSLWGAWVELSPKFFQLITDKPVPLDMRVLRLIKRSPIALDIYCWATYRVSYLKKATVIPWGALMEQIGTGYPNTRQGSRDFRKRFLDGLQKVQFAWPELNASPSERGLLLKPCSPQVPRLMKRKVEYEI